jgi:hypothetical protein
LHVRLSVVVMMARIVLRRRYAECRAMEEQDIVEELENCRGLHAGRFRAGLVTTGLNNGVHSTVEAEVAWRMERENLGPVPLIQAYSVRLEAKFGHH